MCSIHTKPPAKTAVTQTPTLRPRFDLRFIKSLTISPTATGARSSHEARPFQCLEPGCPLRFKRKFTLSEHAKTHTGEKPHTCPVRSCGKSFTTSGNLSRHKRVHPWLKPQVCWVVGCGRTFSNELKFERHTSSHFRSQLDRHHCPVGGCAKAFASTGNLKRHLKQRHPSAPAVTAHHCTRLTTGINGSARDGSTQQCIVERNGIDSSACARRSLPDSMKGYDPLLGKPSDVSDEELLAVLRCLFEDNELEKI